MLSAGRVEKFSASELNDLRTGLMQSGLDSRQATQLLAVFLAGRGYGVNNDLAHEAVLQIEMSGCSLDCMQYELEKVALVM
ncbi:hypothetical protein [Paracidobacterium acidisoli]|uniref:Uncharacterized protein n=1 Tax=Paracidobacterium acidisoli TaxID=2303751 RepID=A0A372INB6_9BACT|nr:hypothetical protein [Paracidobacterium acidisoli]MBT9332100.1 hypothetical protein [Paracidobacterium acidisoli]